MSEMTARRILNSSGRSPKSDTGSPGEASQAEEAAIIDGTSKVVSFGIRANAGSYRGRAIAQGAGIPRRLYRDDVDGRSQCRRIYRLPSSEGSPTPFRVRQPGRQIDPTARNTPATVTGEGGW